MIADIRFGAQIVGLDDKPNVKNGKLLRQFQTARQNLETALSAPEIKKALDEKKTPGVIVSIKPQNEADEFAGVIGNPNPRNFSPLERMLAASAISNNPLTRWLANIVITRKLPPSGFAELMSESLKLLKDLKRLPKDEQEGFRVDVIRDNVTYQLGHHTLKDLQTPEKAKELAEKVANQSIDAINSAVAEQIPFLIRENWGEILTRKNDMTALLYALSEGPKTATVLKADMEKLLRDVENPGLNLTATLKDGTQVQVDPPLYQLLLSSGLEKLGYVTSKQITVPNPHPQGFLDDRGMFRSSVLYDYEYELTDAARKSMADVRRLFQT